MKRIKLTLGKYALVDNNTYEAIKGYRWFAYKGRNTYYTARDIYVRGQHNIRVMMQYCVLGFPLHGFIIDHINGNGLDNRKRNLRYVTVRQNGQNRIEHRNGKLVGVTYCRGRYAAKIKIQGKVIGLGSYDTARQAHKVYLETASSLVPKNG